jgi:hypothetical protein
MKRVLFFCLLLSTTSAAFAQNAVRFGFTTSPGITWMTPDNKNVASDGVRFGFSYGAIVDFVIDNNDRYFITSGLNIALDGGKLIGTSLERIQAQSTLVAKLQYLEIPVGLKLRSNETASNLTFYGVLGLVNGFRIRSRGDYTYFDGINPESKRDETNIGITDLRFFPADIKRINLWQLSMQFEGGAEYRVGDNTSIVGGLFFNNGFTNMIKNDDSERTVGRQIGLRVAVMF